MQEDCRQEGRRMDGKRSRASVGQRECASAGRGEAVRGLSPGLSPAAPSCSTPKGFSMSRTKPMLVSWPGHWERRFLTPSVPTAASALRRVVILELARLVPAWPVLPLCPSGAPFPLPSPPFPLCPSFPSGSLRPLRCSADGQRPCSLLPPQVSSAQSSP